MKKKNSQFNVLRIKSSPYFQFDFIQNEKELIEGQFSNLTYFFEKTPDNTNPTIILSNTHVDYNALEKNLLESTALIIHGNSGWDNLPISLANYHFPIIAGNEIRKNAVVEYILSALIGHFNKIPFSKNWDKNRAFNRSLLNEKHVLIMGFGQIGETLYQAILPLSEKVSVYDPYKGFTELPNEKIDILIPVMSLNPSSREIIDHDFLKKLKTTAIIINAARGNLIKEDALIDFLKMNPDAYAYLDVFQIEPCDMKDFFQLNNISTSSHIAGVFNDIDQRTLEFEQKILNDFLNLSNAEFELKNRKINLKERIVNDFFL